MIHVNYRNKGELKAIVFKTKSCRVVQAVLQLQQKLPYTDNADLNVKHAGNKVFQRSGYLEKNNQ